MAFFFRNKTVNELRKKWGLTTRELAQRVKVDNIEILKIDKLKIKEVPEPLQRKITPILRGDDLDKIPWL
ncbi:MAG: transcriptional regulator [Clostridia bacterium]|jgi:ribosome-binding protein aMBF1 (putative translation factor)|nr:transcriptional regulator [Clostridia bacterium]